jgi:PIN domain nuclease of toxin-antitoxin system
LLRAGTPALPTRLPPFSPETHELRASLPPIHKDPFDLVLIAQALAEELTVVTADKKLTAYPDAFIKVNP